MRSDKCAASFAKEEITRAAQTLAARLRQLAERYAKPMPQIEQEVAALREKVAAHLEKSKRIVPQVFSKGQNRLLQPAGRCAI